jgi:hypothetical protein
MHSIVAIILSAFLVQAHAEDFTQEDMEQFTEMLKDENTMDMVAEMMIDKLSAKLFGEVGRRAALAALPIAAMNLLPQNAQALSQFQNKQDTSRQEFALPKKLDPAYLKREGGRKVKGWGNPYGDGGSTPTLPYGDKFPDVGNSIPSSSQDGKAVLNDNTKGASFYVPPKKEALYGSDKYDNFKFGNKDPYTEAFDITKGAAGKQSDKAIFRKEDLAESSGIDISALAMMMLVMGSGIAFHVVRRRSTSLISAKESLLA